MNLVLQKVDSLTDLTLLGRNGCVSVDEFGKDTSKGLDAE